MKEDQNMPVRFCCPVISSIRNILLQCCFDKDMTKHCDKHEREQVWIALNQSQVGTIV